jgi:hypothetical protein
MQDDAIERLRDTMAGQTGGGWTWMDEDDARAILAHIAALTAERDAAVAEVAQIVAYMKGPAINEAKRKCAAADEGSNKRRDFAVVAVAVEMLADAIEAGAHKEITDGH